MLEIMERCCRSLLKRDEVFFFLLNPDTVNTLVLSLFVERFFLCIWEGKKHVIYRKATVVKLVLSNLYNCICFD